MRRKKKCDGRGVKFVTKEKVKTLGIYARVVGYYRPVSCWNEGKRQEWADRKVPSLK